MNNLMKLLPRNRYILKTIHENNLLIKEQRKRALDEYITLKSDTKHKKIRKNSVFLLNAAERGEKVVVKSLLGYDAEVNSRDANKTSALMHACRNAHRAIAKMLIDRNVDINQRNIYGFSALSLACETGDTELVQMLLDNEANVNSLDCLQITPLFQASAFGYSEIVKALLDKEADQFIASINGHIPLTIACKKGRLEVIKVLIERGAEIDTFYHGFKHKNTWIPLLNVWNNRNLHKAVETKHLNDFDARIVNKSLYYVWNPLFIACEKNHFDLVEWLLNQGADLKIQNLFGQGVFSLVLGNCPEEEGVNLEERKELIGLLRNRIIKHVYELFKMNDHENLRKMVTDSIDDHTNFVINQDSIKAFMTMNLNDLDYNGYAHMFEYFSGDQFKHKYQRDVINVLKDQKELLEFGKKEAMAVFRELEGKENDEPFLEGPFYDEFSFYQIKELILVDNILDNLNTLIFKEKSQKEKRKKALSLFNYIKAYIIEINQLINLADQLSEEINKKCASFVHMKKMLT